MRKLMILLLLLAVYDARAQEITEGISANGDPTVVFGEAAAANGTENEAIVEQPADAPNPLGAPIVTATPDDKNAEKQKTENISPAVRSFPVQDEVSQTTPQNPQISQFSPEDLENEMQNEVYEAGDRVYDVQSYPASDLPQIEQQQNAITNYPEY